MSDPNTPQEWQEKIHGADHDWDTIRIYDLDDTQPCEPVKDDVEQTLIEFRDGKFNVYGQRIGGQGL